jgi:hypothetical protein
VQRGQIGVDEPFLHKPVPLELLLGTVGTVIKGLSTSRS